MPIHERGFASMDPEKQRRIAQQGGRTAHLRGRAHEWTSSEAAAAGRKGAGTRLLRKAAREQAASSAEPRSTPAGPLWELRADDGRLLRCTLTGLRRGVEIQVGYEDDPLLTSGQISSLAVAFRTAESWRQTLIERGHFTEVAAPDAAQAGTSVSRAS